MKKSLLIATVAALAMSAALWGQSITVNSPGAGDEWCQGTSHTITWTSSGVAGLLSIKLRLASAPDAPPVLDITASTANDGAFSWAIPASLAVADYTIRVRTVSDSPLVYDDSANFKVVACTEAGSITVTSPIGTSKWDTGTSHNITWTSPSVAGPMSIKLRLASSPDAPPVLDITPSTADDGTYTWIIPDTVTPGWYQIRVRTVSDSPVIFDDSPDFEIKSVTHIDPGILEKLKRRRYWEVKWPPGPDPCLCPEWKLPDFRDFRELLGDKFGGSIVLLKNGLKLQELGTFGGRKGLPNAVKAKLNRQDFNLLKNGGAKFSIAILDSNGSILNESMLEQEGQVLR